MGYHVRIAMGIVQMESKAHGSLGRAILVAAALLLATQGCSDESDSDVSGEELLTVGSSGSDDFSSIQDAVDSAKAGATILVDAGVYDEHVVIEQSVTLRGAGAGSVIELPGADTGDGALEVHDATDVHIEGFTVHGPGDGIQVRDSSAVVIKAVVASNNGDEGIDVRRSSDVEISGVFANNGDQGIHVRDASHRVTVHTSVISGSVQDGVKVEASSEVTVHSSTISGNQQDGVKIEASADCIVRDNEVTDNGDDGVLVGESTGAQLLGNTITGNFDVGVLLRASPDTILDGNTVSGNAGGDVVIE